MPLPEDTSYSIGELARQVRDVFTRIEGLARRLEEGQFVRTDNFLLVQQGINQSITQIERRIAEVENGKVSKTSFEAMDTRVKTLETAKVDRIELANLATEVAELKDDKKWLIRLIIGFIVLGILGAVFAVAGLQ